MEKLSIFTLAHRRLVVVITVALALAGGGALALLLPNVSEQYEAPGLPAYDANSQIIETYGTGGRERPYVPVITLPEGVSVDTPGVAETLTRMFDAVERDTHARVASYVNTGDRRFVGEGGRVTYALVFGNPVEQGGIPGSALGEGAELDGLVDAAIRPHLPPGASLEVTGLDQLATGEDTGGLNVLVKLLITLGAAVLVLAWVFRSKLAFVPLLIAFVAIPVSYLGVLVMSLFADIHETTVTMAPLFGIGIAIDYALIMVTRWREQWAGGADPDTAVHQAMATAGKSIVFSSLVVAAGLLTMVVLPIPLLRSLGIGGMMVTAASALVSLTLLPIVLARTGRRLDRGNVARGADREANASRVWTSFARKVVRHRRIAAAGATVVLGTLAVVALGININVPVTSNLDHDGPGHDGLVALTSVGIPSGTLYAFDVHVPSGTSPDSVVSTIAALPGVHTVAAPTGEAWRRDGSAVVTVLPVDDGGTEAGRRTIEQVISAVPDGVGVGGYTAQQIDFADVTYGAFGWMLALLSVVSYIMLARAFRSLLLPLKAVLMNLLSLGAVIGSMVVLWQWGWGTEALLGIQPDGVVGTFLPVTIFAFLFGLSMDYEVFILARMREEYDRTGDTDEAVILGIGRTGRLVTAAAAILFFSFAAMATGGELDVAMFASGMALGIVLDATVIRSVLVPATVAMMGRWNWWLPNWAARVLRVEPSPLRSERVPVHA
ncbi:RND superfamily putative drug exporter [Saccharothrix ecbatanensis]|uniref:RND superfamily putative drug exporter n=1 Tax=Saccharothrix ecbatanensis TaxID=1105145 RepID=A0A7W9HUC3_9PSEU|nr:efflux RND transporter permease subunit [Saccharothrix ecbatanensis]MBB5808104.1 RND superfamily putative drug exporter [Saccharothrix ecbatanensis]